MNYYEKRVRGAYVCIFCLSIYNLISLSEIGICITQMIAIWFMAYYMSRALSVARMDGYSRGNFDGTNVGFAHGYRQGLPPGRKRKKPNPNV